MSENEKLRALLAEARQELAVLASYVDDPETKWPTVGLKMTAKAHKRVVTRIDASLAEPVGECARCETLRELADTAAAEQGLAQRRMMEAQKQRDDINRVGRAALGKAGHTRPSEWGAAYAVGWLEERLKESRADLDIARARLADERQHYADAIGERNKAEARDEAARAVLSAICSEFEGAVAHADWRAAGSPGMSVPFTGDFASATQLPSVVSRMRWWAREMRRVIGEKKP